MTRKIVPQHNLWAGEHEEFNYGIKKKTAWYNGI